MQYKQLIYVILLFLIGVSHLPAQTNTDSIVLDQVILHSTGFTFDDWIDEQFKQFRAEPYPPDTISAYVIERLSNGRMVSTKAIRMVQRINEDFDLIALGTDLETINLDTIHKKSTKRYLNGILPYIRDRAMLRLELKARLISIAQLAGDTIGYTNQLQTLADEGLKLGIEGDLLYISSLSSIAYHYFVQGKTQKAEPYYLDILSYDWPMVMEQNARSRFRQMYISSAQQLLECRRGNLEALQNTFFIASTRNELDPIKQRYITELQRKN